MQTITRTNRAAKWYGGKWIRPAKRFAIYLRDRFTCVHCRRDLRDAEPAEITLDHVTPWIDGGSNEATNLVTSCRSCNSSRGCGGMKPAAARRAARQTALPLAKFLEMAKAIIAGKEGRE